jgi:hypothetical protein
MSLIKTQAIVLGKTLETKSIIKGDNHLGIITFSIKEDVKYLGVIVISET